MNSDAIEKNNEKKQNKGQSAEMDALGVTLISVLLGIGLSAFSIARHYMVWWLSTLVACAVVVGLVGAIKLWGRDGWLQKLGRWLTR